jgi:hypothetical protein
MSIVKLCKEILVQYYQFYPIQIKRISKSYFQNEKPLALLCFTENDSFANEIIQNIPLAAALMIR